MIGDVAAGTADPAEARPATRPLAALRSGRFHRVIALLLVALSALILLIEVVLFFQAEDGIRVFPVTGVQTCALPISRTRTSSSTAFSWACESLQRSPSSESL